MRDRVDVNGVKGANRWKHYRRVGISGRWEADAIDLEGLGPTDKGRRGKVVCARHSTLFFVLPGNDKDTLTVVKRPLNGSESSNMALLRLCGKKKAMMGSR